MPSGQTRGYDLVFQFGEAALQNLIGSFFTDNLLPCRLVTAYNALVPGDLGACYAFRVAVSFDRPATLPATDSNPVTIDLYTGPQAMGTGQVGTHTQLMVGLSVNRTAASFDIVVLDVTNELYASSAAATIQALGGGYTTVPIPTVQLDTILRSTIPPLALFPVPVTRGTTDCKLMGSADAVVVEDTSGNNLDAIIVGLTAGGGTAGNLAAFLNSTIPAGADGVLGIAFAWLCRCLSDRLTSALSLPPGSFQNCQLRQSVTIDPGNDVVLTELSLTLQPPRTIAVHAKVSKSGFCYDATGTVDATISLEIENGNLHLVPTFGTPDISLDIPWYCWLAAAIIIIVTAVLAGWLLGIITGVITAIIEGIVVFILWVLTQVAKGIVDGVADAIRQALNSSIPDIQVPLLGMHIVEQNITIDDIGIGLEIVPVSSYPIRAQGELFVPNGSAVDLDVGSVGPPNLMGGDLVWSGVGRSRNLSSLCDVSTARSSATNFDAFSRYVLGTLPYDSPVTLSFAELVNHISFWFFELDIPTLRVFGVVTNAGRFAAVQLTDIADDHMRLRFRTYDDPVPSVSIVGDFGCVFSGLAPATTNLAFNASASPATVAAPPRAFEPGVAALAQLRSVLAATQEPGHLLAPAAERSGASKLATTLRPPQDFGTWTHLGMAVPRQRSACFQAVTTELATPIQYEWVLARRRLQHSSGTLQLNGASIDYDGAHSDVLCLTLHPDRDKLDFDLQVIGTDHHHHVVEDLRCIQWQSTCTVTKPASPDWTEYQARYQQHWGLQLAPTGA